MKTAKAIQSPPNLKLRKKRTNAGKVTSELVNPRFGLKLSASSKLNKASNFLLVQMYSQENEILFI